MVSELGRQSSDVYIFHCRVYSEQYARTMFTIVSCVVYEQINTEQV